MRFKIKTVLTLIALIAIPLALLIFARERGRDRLVKDIIGSSDSVDEESEEAFPIKTIDVLNDSKYRPYQERQERESRARKFELYNEEAVGY